METKYFLFFVILDKTYSKINYLRFEKRSSFLLNVDSFKYFRES